MNKTILARFNNIFQGVFSSSKIITKCIFKVDPSLEIYRNTRKCYWDLTTLILKKALMENVKDNQRILEVGTGEFGILSIWLAKQKKLDITASDIVPIFVEHAREVAKRNKVDISIIESDIVSNAIGYYDIIFWNLPYVPSYFGEKLYQTKNVSKQDIKLGRLGWYGGMTGVEAFRSFLSQAPKVLAVNGKIIAGLNTFFVNPEEIKKIVTLSGLKISSICSSRFNPSKAFVITRN
jgi:methylase of polypeptide subunit release factors